MSKNLEKRHSLLANAKRRHEQQYEKLEKLPSVPKAVIKDWYVIEEQFRVAEGSIDTPEGEYEVGRAVSLQAVFTKSDALVGLGVRSGGWKGQDVKRAEHQKWLECARELLEGIDKPYPRGIKGRIAAKVADKFGKETDTVRKRLRELGVWGG